MPADDAEGRSSRTCRTRAAGAAAAVAAAASVDKSTTTATRRRRHPDLGPGVVTGSTDTDMSAFQRGLNKGSQLAAAEQARENLKRRPLYTSPIPLGVYTFTSGFANRWGSFHGGLDLAAPLGTPIHAATDGVVINAGPRRATATGSGAGRDGTVTMYGHMASSGVLVRRASMSPPVTSSAWSATRASPSARTCTSRCGRTAPRRSTPCRGSRSFGVRMSAYVG